MCRAIRVSLFLSACFLLTGGTSSAGTTAWQQAIQTSEHLQDNGGFKDAEQVLLKLLQEETQLKPEDLAYTYNDLASVYQDQGRFLEAERSYRRAVAEWEKAGETHRAALARTLNNLASLLWDIHKLAEAETLLVRSMNLQIDIVGPRDAAAAALFNNLGMLRFRQKRWADAAAAYEQVLAIYDQHGGDELRAAAVANNLGIVYRKTGRSVETDRLFRRARSMWETAHLTSDTAPQLLVNLAESFWSSNQQHEAETAVKQALAAVESRLGPTHPKTANTLILYAAILRKTHRKAQAREMEKKAQEIGTGETQVQLSRHTVDVSDFIKARRLPRGLDSPTS